MAKPVAVAAALSVSAGIVDAATFKGDYSVSYNEDDPGLVVQVQPDNGNFGPFDLDVGEWHIFHIFDIWTDETWVNKDDRHKQDISVNFNFHTPVAAGQLDGTTKGKTFFGFQWGQMNWDNPLTLSFGPGGTGQMKIYIFGEHHNKFNKGFFGLHEGEHYGSKVYAKIKYTIEPIPLPTTGLMLFAGVLGLAAARRRSQ